MNIDLSLMLSPVLWEDILSKNHALKRGVRGDSGDSGDLDAFIAFTSKVRRSRPFRLFEVDFIDGRNRVTRYTA